MALAQEAGTKVVLVGDPRQIAAVGPGGTFAGLVDRLGAVELTENARQAEAWEREAIRALRQGRSGEAVAAYVAHGRLVVADRAEDLMRACVGDWWAGRAGGEAAMYAATREATWALNALARARMAEAGRLVGPDLVVPAYRKGDYAQPERAFAVGDEVLLCRNQSMISGDVAVVGPDGRRHYAGVRNGQRASVVGLDAATRTLRIRHHDGRVLGLSADYVSRFVTHGYATTAHKAQGETVGQAARLGALGLVAEADRRRGRAYVYGLADAELGLVMASRATDDTRFYLSSATEPGLYEEGVAPEAVDSAQVLASSWIRSGAGGMALEAIEDDAAVRRLAAGCTPAELAARREQLVALGPGDGDPGRRLARARQELAAATAQVEAARRALADAILDVEDAGITAEVPTSEAQTSEAQASPAEQGNGPVPADPGAAPLGLHPAEVARAGVVRAEARAEAALAAWRGAEAALGATEAAQVRRGQVAAAAEAAGGGDRWRASRELAQVERALSIQRRWRLDAMAASPPPWATAVLGTRPPGPARALRWRQGLTLLADLRQTAGFTPPPQGSGTLIQALGQRPSDALGRAAWIRNAAALAQVRTDLGLEVPAERAVGDSEQVAALSRLVEASRRGSERYDSAGRAGGNVPGAERPIQRPGPGRA